MTLQVLNRGGGIEDPTDVWPLAQPDKRDWEIIGMCAGGVNGISSGCAVTPQGTPDMTVAVASGTVVVNNVEVAVTAGNVTVTAAHATLRRRDYVVVNSSGTKSVVAGTAASTPEAPAIPANSVVLALVYLPAADTSITSSQIADKRVSVPSPAPTGGWTMIPKIGSTNITSTTTLALDATCKVALAANGEYAIRGSFVWSAPANHGGLKYGHTGPASPVFYLAHVRVPNSATGLESAATMATAYDTTGVNIQVAGASAVASRFYYEVTIHNGANAGDWGITLAQQTSDADSTVIRAASYVEYARVD